LSGQDEIPRLEAESATHEKLAQLVQEQGCVIVDSLVSTLPVRLQELLGFNQHGPYLGFVAGRPPSEWVQARARAHDLSPDEA